MPDSPRAPDAAHERLRDAYARRQVVAYAWHAPSHVYIIQERVRMTMAMLRAHGLGNLAELRILDVGCGQGYWVRELIQWGADPGRVTGVDLLQERLDTAARLSPAATRWVLGSGADLPFPDGSFDLVLQSTVFSSVLEREVRDRIAREIGRVLAPAGALLWYDFTWDNPGNPDVTGMPRGEIRRLFPGWAMDLRRVTLAPPIARRLPVFLYPLLYPVLSALRFLRTHYLGVLRPPASA